MNQILRRNTTISIKIRALLLNSDIKNNGILLIQKHVDLTEVNLTYIEMPKRNLVKALSWRLWSTSITFLSIFL